MIYLHYDVFTSTPFEGNQLAVFPDAGGLSADRMQTLAREMVREIEHPTAGRSSSLGFAYKLSETPARLIRPSPALGEHTNELLAEIGITGAERDRLLRSNVLRASDIKPSEIEEPNLRV